MNEAWEMAMFWFAIAVVSGWVLRRFYFSKNIALQERLRVFAIAVEVVTMGLLFLPWLPTSSGGFSGWELVVRGDDAGMIALGGLLLFTVEALSAPKRSAFLKAGAVAHMTATVVLFVTMIRIMPGTVGLSLRDIAPIIAALLMLINVVVVLLLWHQLQKRDKLNI